MGYLASQLSHQIQALLAMLFICILAARGTISKTMPLNDASYSEEKASHTNPKGPGYFREDTPVREKDEQKCFPSLFAQQLEKDDQDEHLAVGSYKRRLSTSPQSSRSGAESPWAGELEHPLSLSTSLSASTCALTALHSGSVTNIGTGITTPDNSDMRGYHSAHRMSENPRLDEVSNKLRRSYPVDSEVEEQHGGFPDHGSQTSFSGSSSEVSHSWMPQMMEAEPVGVNNDDVFIEMDLQPPWAPSSPISLLRSSDEESSDGSQHKTRLETEAVDSLGIITQVPGALVAAAPIITSDNTNIHTIDMPELLKTSNRLLEDGRQLLAGGKRQPRPKRAHKFLDEELSGEPNHEEPDSQLRRLSGRQGWYAYDLIE